ncbi:MAG: GntR family transcriptional regulator [Actinomycetota bacterium]
MRASGMVSTRSRRTSSRSNKRVVVRRDIPIPYYAQLARILEDEISSGVWQPGDVLPSEAEIGDVHAVSRTAVRQALDDLARRGIVHKQRGRRTAVAGVTSLVVQEMRGFSEEMHDRGETVRTKVLEQAITVASPRIAHDLKVPNASKVILLSRLRTIDRKTVVRVETYLPAQRFEELLEIDFSETSLYAVLSKQFGIRPSSGSRSIEAVPAGPALSKQLGVSLHAPLLKLTAVNRDQNGVPFEVFHAWYRGDATRFELVVG